MAMQITIEYYPFTSDILAWSETVLAADVKEAREKMSLKEPQKYYYKFRNEQGQYWDWGANDWVTK